MLLRWLKTVTIPMIRLTQALSYQHLIQAVRAQMTAEPEQMMMVALAQTTAVKILAAELEQQTAAEQVDPLVLRVLRVLLALQALQALQAQLVLQAPNRPQN